MKVYIAGAYTPKNCSLHDASLIAHRNTMLAVEAAWDLIRKGHFPYTPHLSHFLHIYQPADAPAPKPEFWYDFDLVFMRDCDAILMLPNWEQSLGAKNELGMAKEWGLKVYFSLDEVPPA
jgi:hypothetical protein